MSSLVWLKFSSVNFKFNSAFCERVLSTVIEILLSDSRSLNKLVSEKRIVVKSLEFSFRFLDVRLFAFIIIGSV